MRVSKSEGIGREVESKPWRASLCFVSSVLQIRSGKKAKRVEQMDHTGGG